MRISLVVILLACAPLSAQPQEKPAGRPVLTPQFISELAEEARTNNAGLWAARSRITAAGHNANAIKIWRDPEVMIGGMAAETMMREEDGDIMYGAEQMLPVFGKEKAQRKAARAEILVEEAELEARFQTLRKELAEALYQAALADELLALAREDQRWIDTLAAVAEQRYAAGTASQVELLRAQNERSRRAQQVRAGENSREASYVKVNQLLNRSMASAWEPLALPELANPVPLNSRILDYATKFEPRLKMLRQRKAQAEAMAEATRKERRPDLSAAVEARQYSRTGDYRSTSAFLKMTLPWFNRGKNNAAVRRDEARVSEIDYEIENYTRELLAEIHHAVMMIDNARREAVLARDEMIPRGELALQSAEAAWRSGRGDFRDALEARRMLLEAETMRLKAVAEQHIALADLVLCCGLGDMESLEMLLKNEEGAELEEAK